MRKDRAVPRTYVSGNTDRLENLPLWPHSRACDTYLCSSKSLTFTDLYPANF